MDGTVAIRMPIFAVKIPFRQAKGVCQQGIDILDTLDSTLHYYSAASYVLHLRQSHCWFPTKLVHNGLLRFTFALGDCHIVK